MIYIYMLICIYIYVYDDDDFKKCSIRKKTYVVLDYIVFIQTDRIRYP